jgi:enamine deaminase RidA (YjgF/YER057c/UK114 family)
MQSLDNLVAVTVHATDMPALMASAEIFAKRFGAAPPSSTWVGVTELAHPDQLVEITATAADLTDGGAK